MATHAADGSYLFECPAEEVQVKEAPSPVRRRFHVDQCHKEVKRVSWEGVVHRSLQGTSQAFA